MALACAPGVNPALARLPRVPLGPGFTLPLEALLARLELRGVPAGDRWTELADKAEARDRLGGLARIPDPLRTSLYGLEAGVTSGATAWGAATEVRPAASRGRSNPLEGVGR